ncbi:MAG: hypothetical protein K2X97_20535 [Mycobacteriaceae bacterium]|nr:hypothetical protein [Mycobacteriaceae bacterium]
MAYLVLPSIRALRARIARLPWPDRLRLGAELDFALSMPSQQRRWDLIFDVTRRALLAEDRAPIMATH